MAASVGPCRGCVLDGYTVIWPGMETRTIKVSIEKDQALFDELMTATLEHREYDGCFIMMYSEYRGSEGQMVGAFILRERE